MSSFTCIFHISHPFALLGSWLPKYCRISLSIVRENSLIESYQILLYRQKSIRRTFETILPNHCLLSFEYIFLNHLLASGTYQNIIGLSCVSYYERKDEICRWHNIFLRISRVTRKKNCRRAICGPPPSNFLAVPAISSRRFLSPVLSLPKYRSASDSLALQE